MATRVPALMLLALLAPSICSSLPQGGAAVDAAPPGEADPPAGYQYQKLNPYNGSYKFAFEGEDGTFRVEQRLGSGQLRGISGVRDADGGISQAFRYEYDGVKYRQEPLNIEGVPSFLRSASAEQQLPQLVQDLQLFPEYFP